MRPRYLLTVLPNGSVRMRINDGQWIQGWIYASWLELLAVQTFSPYADVFVRAGKE